MLCIHDDISAEPKILKREDHKDLEDHRSFAVFAVFAFQKGARLMSSCIIAVLAAMSVTYIVPLL